jgi:coenzyme F420-0:L-glutamate ligase
MSEVRVIPVTGVGEIRPGDDLAATFVEATGALEDRDILVVAQKVVSKAEGRLAPASSHEETVLAESVRVLRKKGGTIISETRHGLVCANAGVDRSNVQGNEISLLPLDPDLSARRLRARIERLTSKTIGVIVSDTFGRAWRRGQTNVAIGVAGMEPFNDYRGHQDSFGKDLSVTEICAADELAGAAELVMRKSDGICAAIVRGAQVSLGRGSAAQIIRPRSEDLFR